MTDDDLLEVGHIRRAHGLRGEVFVQLLSDSDVRVAPGASCSRAARRSWSSPHGWPPTAAGVVKFAQIPDRTAAERYANRALRGRPIEDPDALWVHEMIGARVVEVDGTERGVCVVGARQSGRRSARTRLGALVPSNFVVSIDGDTIRVDTPDGLFDLPDAAPERRRRDGLRIDVFSLFPGLVDDFCSESLLGKARGQGLLDLRCHDIREQTTDVHRTVDDAPFGGGAGMVMRAQPIFEAVEAVDPPRPLFLLGPGWSSIRPGAGRRTRGRRRVQPAVRTLRGRRPSGPSASRRR